MSLVLAALRAGRRQVAAALPTATRALSAQAAPGSAKPAAGGGAPPAAGSDVVLDSFREQQAQIRALIDGLKTIPVPLSGDAAAVKKFAADVDALKKRVGMPDDADLEAALAAQRVKAARGDVRRLVAAASVDGVDDGLLADVTAALEAAEKESGAALTDGNGKGWSVFANKLTAIAKARGLDDVAKVKADAAAATIADTVADLRAAAADAMSAAARRDGLDEAAAPSVASLKPKW